MCHSRSSTPEDHPTEQVGTTGFWMISRSFASIRRSAVIQIAIAASKTTGFSQFRYTDQSYRPSSAMAASPGLYIPVEEAIQKRDEYTFLDGSWWLPNQGRDARQDFCEGRISGAKFFDIDDVCLEADLNPKNLPHMMPQPKLFGSAMDALGVRKEDKVVIYGQEGCPFLHRSWYTLRSMGHEHVQLLEGSLVDWKSMKGPVETSPIEIMKVVDLDLAKEPSYRASDPSAFVASMQQVIEALDDDSTQIVDVRSADRFFGRVDEPRPGLRLGHMPGAQNLFFANLLKPQSSILLPDEELRDQLQDLPKDKEIVASCGSGATACVLVAALYQIGRTDARIYDGSWCEWGADPDVPIVKSMD